VFGRCKHAFHMTCVMQMIESGGARSEPKCPLCRQPWEFVEYQSPARRPAGAEENAAGDGHDDAPLGDGELGAADDGDEYDAEDGSEYDEGSEMDMSEQSE